tara:strand:- start:580 stop:783 length:204 start_codon:yes stop_codon:yes gene_type:complete
MNIFVNDEPKEVAEGTSLLSLSNELIRSNSKGWAFALNDSIIPKVNLENTLLSEGDRVLLIQATQGG